MPARWRSWLTFENGALLYTLVTGVAMAVGAQLSPNGIRPVVDERYYIEWARVIASGRLVGDEPFFLDALAAYLLGGIFALTHGSLLAGRLFYALLGVGTVALLGRLARTLFSRREGAVAMWLLALYGPHTFSLGWVLKEALTVHCTAWVLLYGVRVMSPSARARDWAVLGAFSGALVLCRGNYVPLVPLLCLWLGWRVLRGGGEARARWLRLAAFAAALAVPLGLGSAHNWVAGRSWVPFTAHGGHNFWLGNNPQASGTYDHWDFIRAQTQHEKEDFKAEAERRLGRTLALPEVSDYWFKEGLRFWKEQPLAALRLLAKKYWLLVHDYEIPDTYDYTCFRTWFTPVLWFTPLGFGSTLGLALVGAFLAARDDRRALFPIAFFALYGSSVAAFFVFDRYRIPLCLVLCLFAAHALVQLYDRLRTRRRQGLGAAGLVVAAATAVAFVPTPISRQQDLRDAYCVGQAGLNLWWDGLDAQAQPLLDAARKRGDGAPWIEKEMERLQKLKAAQRPREVAP